MNGHGGNTNILNLVVQLAKRKFKVMVAAPVGPSTTDIAKELEDRQKRHWDVHSGPTETGAALHFFPELVSQLYRACSQPNTDDFTSSGVYGKNDPRDANPEEIKVRFEERVNFVVEFIKTWKTIPIPPAFKD